MLGAPSAIAEMLPKKVCLGRYFYPLQRQCVEAEPAIFGAYSVFSLA